jgi:hypothetical protein
MLTIFALPKPFKGHFGVIQRNAVSQWTRLQPRPEILLFGNEEGTADIAQEFGVQHFPEVKRNEYGTPLLSDLFGQAQSVASSPVLCYVNADIMLLGNLMEAVQRVLSWRDRFLMVGLRTNVNLDEPAIYDSSNQEGRLLALVSRQGQMAPPNWIDYFAFSRGLVPSFPAFAIGRPWWDNWFLWKAKNLKVPLIDASKVVLAVHQNHDYSHHPQGHSGVLGGEEAKRNRNLARLSYCTIDDATYKLTDRGIEPYARPFVSTLRQDMQIWWRELLRITFPVRHPLGLHWEGISGVLHRLKFRSN